MKKILPILIVLVGLAAGVGAGKLLQSPPPEPIDCDVDPHNAACDVDESAAHSENAEPKELDPTSVQYVKLNNQFVIPVVKDSAVSALVVMSLSIETTPEMVETVFKVEPKLRDVLLRVMFRHANSGGFEGQFTSSQSMKDLRGSLLEAARGVLGDVVSDVLITDILRQDV